MYIKQAINGFEYTQIQIETTNSDFGNANNWAFVCISN